MKDIRNIRKIIINDVVVCIAEELLLYLDINKSVEQVIFEKKLEKGFDYEIIPRHLLDNQINLNKYKNKTEIYVLQKSGIFKIINNRRQTEAIEVSNYFSIPIKFIKEREYLNIIKKAFKHYDCKQQYFVPKEEKSGYYIDLYISGKDKNIAVEVDENGHSTYDKEFEIEREKHIKDVLGCTFIRFNPDSKDFNVGSVINKIMSTKNEPVKTKYEFTDDNFDVLDVIQDIVTELQFKKLDKKLMLIDFIDNIEIEFIHMDIKNNFKYMKNINSDDFILYSGNTPILNTKDIIEINFLEDKDTKYISVDVLFIDNISNKNIVINYIIKNNNIYITLKDGLRKKQYIQNYLNLIKSFELKQKQTLTMYYK